MPIFIHTCSYVSVYIRTCTHTHIIYTLCIDLLSATIYKGLIKQKNKFANTDLPIPATIQQMKKSKPFIILFSWLYKGTF